MMIHRTITIADFQFIDGRLQHIGTRAKSKTFEKRDKAPRSLATYWLDDAPIAYDPLEREMVRVGMLDELNLSWQLFHKGGSPQRYLRAFYNLCFRAKCLPGMSGPEQMGAFNTSFKTDLNHYRGFNGSDDCRAQEKEIINMLSAFGNVFSERNHTTELED